MDLHRISSQGWLAIAGVAVVAFAAAFDGLVLLTIALLVGVPLAAWIAPFVFLEGWLLDDSPPRGPRPTPSRQPGRARQFSLKRLFLAMVVAALAWRFAPDLLPYLPDTLAALGMLLGILLAVAVAALFAATSVLVLFAWGVGIVVMLSSAFQQITLGVRHLLRSDQG